MHKYRLATTQHFFCNKHKKYAGLITKGMTSIEKIVVNYIKERGLPYRYTGNGSFWIENINPDFVNINGEKRAIEVNGCYWHNCPTCFSTPQRTKRLTIDIDRNKIYNKYGWSVTTLWEHDIKSGKFKGAL
jgi:G:T-mismatch repair DNA endonuclease (very short patch repair protein)